MEYVSLDDQFQDIDPGMAEGAKVGLLNLSGIILPEALQDPLSFGDAIISPSWVSRKLNILRQEEDLEALLLMISSPGGAVAASDEIAHIVSKFQEEYPVYVYTADLMASGGYYIAAGANKIFAHRQAEVGSIGALTQIPNLSGLAERFGIELETYTSAELKDLGNPLRPRTEREIAIIQNLVQAAHDDFAEVVQQGRNFSAKELAVVTTGEIWTGTMAVKNGLIDGTAYLDELSALIAADLDVDQVHYVEHLDPLPLLDQIFASPMLQADPVLTRLSRIIPLLPRGVYYLWY